MGLWPRGGDGKGVCFCDLACGEKENAPREKGEKKGALGLRAAEEIARQRANDAGYRRGGSGRDIHEAVCGERYGEERGHVGGAKASTREEGGDGGGGKAASLTDSKDA